MSLKRPRVSSVSFSRSQTDPNETNIPSDDEDNIQISLAPRIQSYLARASQRKGFIGRCLPIPFERAARNSWWHPHFDSEILEGQYKNSAFPQLRLRFRYALLYIFLVLLSWFIYFLSSGLNGTLYHFPILCSALAIIAFFIVCLLVLTHTDFFHENFLFVSICVAILFYILSLCFVFLSPSHFGQFLEYSSSISPVGHFSICIEVLLLIYTVIPMPLYVCVISGILYSVAFELLTWFLHKTVISTLMYHLIVRILSQLCIHLIGLHILIMTNVRMRGTFMKVGQSLLVRRQLEMEKQLKEKMIHSVMPPKVADWLLNDDANFAKNSGRNSNPETTDLKSLFRPFNMHRMENVSILFADIVGFTKMSSNKSAEELVGILNDLFERFDHLCSLNDCEKISTLGDCYYCVSGCPEPNPNHAKSCVEMGLSMIQAIKQFDSERNEGVNMRVGVHTGTVLCGIVGTRRFKFDVWSNDVTLANRMESTGKPGMVHISEKTCEFLNDMYVLEEGEPVFGYKTYFILNRKSDRHPSLNGSTRSQLHFDSLQLIISPPSISPMTRPRLLSCNDQKHLKPVTNPNLLSPGSFKVKTNSLPNILDSEGEEMEINDDKDQNSSTKSPVSNSGSERTYKTKKWRIPKFLKKQTETIEVENSQTNEEIQEYQQVPEIIETVEMKPDDDIKNDIIDVKSYISQSRSDIGNYEYSPDMPFLRSSSYRSQTRSPNDVLLDRTGSNKSNNSRLLNCDLSPLVRGRSATMAARVEMDSLEIPSLAENHISECMSVNSRKDSGIRSNSRRSSIQQQIYVMNQTPLPQDDILQHRVSGYYTSSQSSICSPQNTHLPAPFCDQFGTRFQKLRKQSDLQLIRCVQDNSKSKHSYFIKPPLSNLTLFFRNKKMEQDYRNNVHTFNDLPETLSTLATSRYNTYFDILISAIIFLAVTISLFFVYVPTILSIIVFILSLFLLIFALVLCVRQIIRYKEDKIFLFFSKWYRWQTFGAVIVSLPILAVLSNFSCVNALTTSDISDDFFCYLFFVGVIHFCNFTQLNFWMKNILVTIFSIIFLCLVTFLDEQCRNFIENSLMMNNNTNNESIFENATSPWRSETHNLYEAEIFVDIFLLLVLVWFLNREFEISYRLSFHANFVANRDKAHIQSMKNQADWLLHNIIPKHVADQLKKSAKYSENHKNVGIIFASIVNFNEMYDETYLGGKEYLRVLNELIADFDELLTLPQFRSVEKIKTIGSTFMAASGLNPEIRRDSQDPYQHLYALMDFAIAMQNVIDNFNRDLLEFNLILRVGYNFGDVTAGVIGTSKLYYDIWGDAVNIASRMDSTGLSGRIQVGEYCISILGKKYEFEPRGSVYVKGKDNMNVFLLLRKKDDDDYDKS